MSAHLATDADGSSGPHRGIEAQEHILVYLGTAAERCIGKYNRKITGCGVVPERPLRALRSLG